MLAETTILSEALSQRGVSILLDVTIKGLVILAAAGGMAALLRRRSAAARHMVWSVAAACLLALPILSTALPHWNVPILPAAIPDDAPAAVSGPPPAASPAAESAPRTPPSPTRAEVPPRAPLVTAPPEPPRGVRIGWAGWVVLAYLAGVVISAVGLVAGTVVVRLRLAGASALTGPAWRALADELSEQLGLRRRVRLIRAGPSAICGVP
ncbi:MAG: hypothetical protein ACYS5V_17635 [Planctomycetota bacterium]|jgi:hypothetical protein